MFLVKKKKVTVIFFISMLDSKNL